MYHNKHMTQPSTCIHAVVLALVVLAGAAAPPARSQDQNSAGHCTPGDLDGLFNEQGTPKPGATVWIAADHRVPRFETPQEIDDTSRVCGPTNSTRCLSFGEQLVVRDRTTHGSRTLLKVGNAKEFFWVPVLAKESFLLCRPMPLLDPATSLLRKAIINVHEQSLQDAQEATPQVRYFRNPSQGLASDTAEEARAVSVFDYFFVFAEHGDYLLLGPHQRLEERGSLLGWVYRSEIIEWNTSFVTHPARDAKFLLNPTVGAEEIATSDAEWKHFVRRPPALGRDESGTWVKVAIPVHITRHQEFAEQLQRLLKAERAIRRPLVVFLVDTTHSMKKYAEQVRDLSQELVTEIKRVNDQTQSQSQSDVMFAVYGYADIPYRHLHPRTFQGATGSAEQVRRAFDRWVQATREAKTYGPDDAREDIDGGIRNVFDSELSDEVLKDSLVVLIIIGDAGAREKAGEMLDGRYAETMRRVVPVFLYAGSEASDGFTPFRATAQRITALSALERGPDAVSNASTVNVRALQDTSGDLSAVKIRQALADTLQEVTALPKVTGEVTKRLAVGQRWADATRGTTWPLNYRAAFRELLRSNGFSEDALDHGTVIAVQQAWIPVKDQKTEVFVTRTQMETWRDLFLRLRKPENWTTSAIRDAINTYLGAIIKEDLHGLTLEDLLKKEAAIPIETAILRRWNIAQLTELNDSEQAKLTQDLAQMGEAYDLLLQNQRPEFSPVDNDGIASKYFTKASPRTYWFSFSPGSQCAYIPTEDLP